MLATRGKTVKVIQEVDVRHGP